MAQDGAMEGVDAVIALHVDAGAPVGEISLEPGPASAGVDSFSAVIRGRGAHGAYPEKGLDPVYLAAHVILALHGIVSRRLSPFDPAVITVGSIHGGQAANVIPEEVEISGTIRYEDASVQTQIHEEMERALATARTLGGDYEFKLQVGGKPIINDERIVALIKQVAADLLGAEQIKPGEKGMGAEDFSVFTSMAPGAMFRLGCLIEGDERRGHNPLFDLDEGCLPIGAAILAEAALRVLRAGA